MQPGIYFLSTANYQKFTDKPNDVILRGRLIWIYNHSGGDERIGILIFALSEKIIIGRAYGTDQLTWYIK